MKAPLMAAALAFQGDDAAAQKLPCKELVS
jgi:hypothetical protein